MSPVNVNKDEDEGYSSVRREPRAHRARWEKGSEELVGEAGEEESMDELKQRLMLLREAYDEIRGEKSKPSGPPNTALLRPDD